MNILYMLLWLTPIIIVDIVAFYFIQWGYQLLIVAIESFFFSFLLIVLSLIEFFRIKKRFFNDEDDSYLAINPKMFDNAYTVAGGIPHDGNSRSAINRQKGVPQFEDSQNMFINHSYSYNKDGKYNDATNQSSIAIMSRFHIGKGVIDDEERERNINLHKIINKMHGDSSLLAGSAINIMDLKDNQIFKKRKDYDKKLRLDDEDNFDRFDRRYLRRWESFEDFREYDETFAPDKKKLQDEKCISFPPSPRSLEKLDQYLYFDQENFRDKMKAEFLYNNLYADKSRSGYGFDSQSNKYGRSLERLKQLGFNRDDIDPDLAQSILDGVLENISGDEDGQFMRGGKRVGLSKKRMKEIPDFEIEDIMGEFDIDDQGNYIILRNDDNGNLEDKNERTVNRRGYLVDKNGNVVDKAGNLIFKAKELDSDDEIPPPFSFEKRKTQLLKRKADEFEDFRVENIASEDENQTWMKHKRKELADTMSGEETPVESMVEDSPGHYLSEKMSRKSKQTKTNKTIHEDNINIDIVSQKETMKFDSTFRPESVKFSRKAKRLTSARVKGPKNDVRPEKIFDGFIRDTPLYFNQIPVYPESRRDSPKRKKLQKKGHHDSSLNRIYGNIDPFLYKDESTLSGIRLDKVVNLKDKKNSNQMHLAESAEVETKFKYDGTDEELDSEINRFSGMDRVPSKYKDKGLHRDTSMKNRLNELEDIYTSKMKQKEEEMQGRKTQYNSRIKNIGYKNSNTITRNMFHTDKSIESDQVRTKKKKGRPVGKTGEYVLKHRKLEDGGWV